ncbi:MAG: TIGR04283 family arsenosugar biosynthesis glycosyltransferase [Candidatus Rokubacteria bacterium]|nr:TIGR04283 family arsenosugar biosynthesis glycosyltransferase [Candidatus Rokubacteria bacterium]
MISVVIPARNEAACLGETLAHLAACTPPDGAEVVVAVGGSTDGTAGIARGMARLVLGTHASRAGLLNAGARAARGSALLFLHADTLPPPDYVPAIEAALADPAVVGGAFDFEFRECHWRLGAIAALNRLRCRLTGNFYGDQGIFVRRAAFDRIGGFPRRRLFEDLVFSQAMRCEGRTVLLRGRRVRSSGRRFLRPDWTRPVGLITWLLLLHTLGCDTEGYAARYHAARATGDAR